jgi:two-component system response regulator HydG
VDITSRDGKQILVVDDDRAVLALVRQWLTAAGYTVVACDAFATAKQCLSDAAPNVLVTDVRLGAFNGLQLVILAKELDPRTMAVVMSAFDDPSLRREAMHCGAAYLPKPFSRQQMLTAVQAAVHGATVA